MQLTEQINHFFQHRSEPERIIFERMRQALSLPTVGVGRRDQDRASDNRPSVNIDEPAPPANTA